MTSLFSLAYLSTCEFAYIPLQSDAFARMKKNKYSHVLAWHDKLS